VRGCWCGVAMRDYVALSSDGADPYRTTANRRGGGGRMTRM
jgi:hypothetical protein